MGCALTVQKSGQVLVQGFSRRRPVVSRCWDPYVRRSGFTLFKQRRDWNAKRVSEPGDVPNTRIAEFPLDASEVGAMELGLFGQTLLRPALLMAEIPDSKCQCPDNFVFESQTT